MDLAAAPQDDRLVLANHRFELILVDLKRGTRRVLDRSAHGRIAGIAWSPDGRWIAYGIAEAPHRCVLRVVPAAGGKPRTVTRTVLQDAEPAFDPEGKYLYFLSYRVFDPVYDNLHFELGFPRGVRPYLLTLRKDLRPPFPPEPKTPPPGAAANGKPKGAPKKPGPVEIDFDGIEDRAAPFPVPEGRYTQIAGITGGALFLSFPVEGSLGEEREDPRADRGTLETFTFEEQNRATLAEGVGGFAVSADAKTVLYRAGSRLRAIPAGDKPPDKASGEKPSRKSGWIDLGRVRAEVDPAREWPQMFREAWRLMRDHFWVPDLSGVDWKAVLRRYLPLLERVATRSEFSDLVWEMQGEMGTSHCYESGGDYRSGPAWPVGKLAAEFAWDRRRRGYRVTRIVRGDSAEPKASSPLSGPGVRIREGDVIVAVNGQATRADRSIHELLVNLAGQDVQLTLAGDRNVQVKTLRGEESARYREWVDRNRLYVHRATKGKAGYVHIPDMGPRGFSEFHRQYLPEVDRGGLLIDVRCNGGGHVSQLLLEKLRRERIGYDVKRHGPPEPYPADSPGGPMVCLTDEQAGSDGDMFSHAFKMYGLGPLVGTRTWGGVVGIWPRHALVDGSVTTQPEFSFWFRDVGFGIENHGTDPDVTVDHAPHDDLAGRDVQLERATEILNDLLKKRPPGLPEFGPRPKLPLPRRLQGR
ncbi:MAG: PDZ domain-containing protein [Planctomycetes bacterium]|nr:PDZ domain-containing protein [Planctomycetota bacterium]